MPTFVCLQCCDCRTYQSTQRRKDNKFTCKLCGKKQSVIKVHARSERAADIRKTVQRLNMARGNAEEEYEQEKANREYENEYDYQEVVVNTAEATDSEWKDWNNSGSTVQAPVEDEDNESEFVTAMPDWQGRRGREKKRQRANRANESTDGGTSNERRQKRVSRNRNDERDRPRTTTLEYPASSKASNREAVDTFEDGIVLTTGGDGAYEEEVDEEVTDWPI